MKYKNVFNARCRKDGGILHIYLSDLRLSYEKAYSPPKVNPLPEEASDAKKQKESDRKERQLSTIEERMRIYCANLLMGLRMTCKRY